MGIMEPMENLADIVSNIAFAARKTSKESFYESCVKQIMVAAKEGKQEVLLHGVNDKICIDYATNRLKKEGFKVSNYVGNFWVYWR